MMNDRYMDLLEDKHKEAYLQCKENGISEGLGSHQPVLIHVLNTIKTGNVLEFGVGYHSTPIMNLICGMQNRQLLSVDTEKKWFNKFLNYKNSNHEFVYLTFDELHKAEHRLFQKKYAIAFIDGFGPLRQPFIEKIIHQVDYFIVHDTEINDKTLKYYNWDFLIFKHTLQFEQCRPITAVFSNLNKINENICF